MTSSEVRVEITRLASLLGCSEDALGFLDAQEPAVLKELRDRLTDRLFDANRDILLGLAKTTKIVPGGVAAKISQLVLERRPGDEVRRHPGLVREPVFADAVVAQDAQSAACEPPREAGGARDGK